MANEHIPPYYISFPILLYSSMREHLYPTITIIKSEIPPHHPPPYTHSIQDSFLYHSPCSLNACLLSCILMWKGEGEEIHRWTVPSHAHNPPISREFCFEGKKQKRDASQQERTEDSSFYISFCHVYVCWLCDRMVRLVKTCKIMPDSLSLSETRKRRIRALVGGGRAFNKKQTNK